MRKTTDENLRMVAGHMRCTEEDVKRLGPLDAGMRRYMANHYRREITVYVDSKNESENKQFTENLASIIIGCGLILISEEAI